MNLGEKLQDLRNRERLSQEELAEKIGISRQAISKWESGQSTPDLKKLIMLSELYDVTIDSLVKDENEVEDIKNNEISYRENIVEEKQERKQILIDVSGFFDKSRDYEYKSEREIFGLPLIHINKGKGLKKAKGIIAIGNISYGFIAGGFLSFGIISGGILPIGLLSFGVLAIGLLLGVGAVAIGTISIGAISIGIFSFGALAIGKYAVGAGAIGSSVAIGDYANGHVAIGNKLEGMNQLPLDTSMEEIKNLLKSEYPNMKDWFINIIEFFVKGIKIGTR